MQTGGAMSLVQQGDTAQEAEQQRQFMLYLGKTTKGVLGMHVDGTWNSSRTGHRRRECGGMQALCQDNQSLRSLHWLCCFDIKHYTTRHTKTTQNTNTSKHTHTYTHLCNLGSALLRILLTCNREECDHFKALDSLDTKCNLLLHIQDAMA
eukprot:451373-Pelagomonas_calceolata.AAC.1